MGAGALAVATMAAVAVVLGGATNAQAWTLTTSGSALVFNDDVGTPDGLSIDDAGGGQLRLSNPSSAFAGPVPAGCALTEDGDITCASAGVSAISATLGAASDSASVSIPVPVTFDGGDGDDVLTGGSANDSLAGGPGNDVLDTGAASPQR